VKKGIGTGPSRIRSEQHRYPTAAVGKKKSGERICLRNVPPSSRGSYGPHPGEDTQKVLASGRAGTHRARNTYEHEYVIGCDQVRLIGWVLQTERLLSAGPTAARAMEEKTRGQGCKKNLV